MRPVVSIGQRLGPTAYTSDKAVFPADSDNFRSAVLVKAYGADAYIKLVNAFADVSAVTVSSADCDITIPAGTTYPVPAARSVDLLITGNVSCLEVQ